MLETSCSQRSQRVTARTEAYERKLFFMMVEPEAWVLNIAALF